ncbi:MAG TPA: hypothetical protein VH519_09565 [Hyphomicrobiaceae bacterium]|jgi:hypothetical protein
MVRLAYRDLLHDRLGPTLTPIGIVFSFVEVAVPFGLRYGAQNRIAAMLGHTHGQPREALFATKSFDDPSLLPVHANRAILCLQGVTGTGEPAVGFVAWRKLSGDAAAALLGSDARNKRSLPGNGIAAGITERASPNAGAALNLIVVIPALAVLRALGAVSGFIRPISLAQIVLRAIMAYLKSVPFRLSLIYVLRDAAPLIVMTTNSALLLSALTVDLCVFAPSSAITITRIDPAVVLSR